MTVDILVKLFEHNNWANQQTLQACAALTDAQLDALPQSATKGSLRETVLHLATGQHNYLATLTLPLEARQPPNLALADLAASMRRSGDGLLALAADPARAPLQTPHQTRNGYLAEPWVVMLQAINHATEHREQINSMLTALGHTPPDLDGWTYGQATGALVPADK